MSRIALVPLLFCLSQPVHAQIPDTPAGRRLTGWLEAFNSDRPESLRAFVEQHVAPTSRTRLLSASPQTADFRARTGGFDVRKVDESASTHLAAFVQERG